MCCFYLLSFCFYFPFSHSSISVTNCSFKPLSMMPKVLSFDSYSQSGCWGIKCWKFPLLHDSQAALFLVVNVCLTCITLVRPKNSLKMRSCYLWQIKDVQLDVWKTTNDLSIADYLPLFPIDSTREWIGMCYKSEQRKGLNLIQVRLAVPACSAFPWPSSSASLLPMADQLIRIPLVLYHISLSEVEPSSFSYFYALLL